MESDASFDIISSSSEDVSVSENIKTNVLKFIDLTDPNSACILNTETDIKIMLYGNCFPKYNIYLMGKTIKSEIFSFSFHFTSDGLIKFDNIVDLPLTRSKYFKNAISDIERLNFSTCTILSSLFLLKSNQEDNEDCKKLSSSTEYSEHVCKNVYYTFNKEWNSIRTFLMTGSVMNHDEYVTSIHISPDVVTNPIIMATVTLINTIIKVNDYCYHCGCTLGLSFRSVRLTSCNKVECTKLFYNLGRDMSPLYEIRRDPNVADLIISLFLNSDPKYIDDLYIFRNLKHHEITLKLKEYGEKLPSVSTLMNTKTDEDLMDLLGEELYQVLCASFSSCQLAICTLSQSNSLIDLPAQGQFICLNTSALKEDAYEKFRKKFGDVYLFHGSTISSFYNIFRLGLKIYKEEKFVRNGRAQGNGIYFGRDLLTSFSYSSHHDDKTNNNYCHSIYGSNIKIVLLCTVCKINDLKQIGNIFVLRNEDACKIRYVLINPNKVELEYYSNPPKNAPSPTDILVHCMQNLFVK